MEKELKRRRKITAVISIIAIIAVFLAIFAFIQKNRVDKLMNQTFTQYKDVLSNRLASEAERVLPDDNYKAIRIAEAAYKIGLPSPSALVVRVLCSAAYSTKVRPFYYISLKHEGLLDSAIFSPDGSLILTASQDRTAIIWPTPETIMDYLKTAPIPKLTEKEKKELGIYEILK